MSGTYVELHCHSYYSLLDGASSVADLVTRGAELGMPALALTDHDGLYGAVPFWRAARDAGIRPIIGAELTLTDGSHLTVLAETQLGYSNLCRIISRAQLAGQKRQPVLTLETLDAHARGLICLSGCRRSPIIRAIQRNDYRGAFEIAWRLVQIFGADHFLIELQRHLLPNDGRLTGLLIQLACRLGVGIIATNNGHYATPAGQPLQDVLTCIRHHTTVDAAGSLLWPNAERYLKSPVEMAALFADVPEALKNTLRIAERCDVSLDLSAYRLPDFPVPAASAGLSAGGETPFSYLYRLCQAGAQRRYRPVTPAVSRQLAHELDVIERTGLATYFLVVWDIRRFCRQRGIPCQGRGSAANSLVAYVLGITAVDPLQHDLLFERFLSEESRTMPDIDLDISTVHRDEVIDYIYQTYGEDHTAMVCNMVTFQTRSAIRDVGKALGFPAGLVDQMAKAVDPHTDAELDAQLAQVEAFRERTQSHRWRQLLRLVREILGFPRHLSIHNGGMIITGPPLIDIVPIERTTMPGRVVVQWNKDSVEDAGLIKIDLLGLRTLSLIHTAVGLIQEHEGAVVDMEALPLDDPAVYDLLGRADTVGAFQVESRAQAQLLPRLKPREFNDIVVAMAIIRPGPIQGGVVHPYLDRRAGREPVTYLHPALEPILRETLGVMLYQEQVMKVAMAIAGFTAGEADALRRAMSRVRSVEEMAALRAPFVQGALRQGVNASVAHAIFDQVAGFAGYGFCKSHAASFALIAYATCWLKIHHPVAFYCALLNQQPMGFYSSAVVAGDARRHGVRILRPDVNRSRSACSIENGAIRLGFCFVKGVGEASGVQIERARQAGPFESLPDFCRRTRLPRRAIERLILVGAMDAWGIPRRQLLWELGKLDYPTDGLDVTLPPDTVRLPALTHQARIELEYDILGLPIGEHVMALYEERLRRWGVRTSEELEAVRDGERVRVAGLQVVRQRPGTAKGMVFVSLEDPWGLINVVVRPAVYDTYRAIWRGSQLLLVEGVVERREGVVNVIAIRSWPMAQLGCPLG